MEKLDMSKIDLDAPAFASHEAKEIPTAEAPLAESGGVKDQPTSGGEPVVEEQQVPYSRLKEVIEARREAERRADEAMERLNSLERQPRYERPDDTSDSSFESGLKVWQKIYGDRPEVTEAYKLEYDRQNSLRKELRKEALEAVREERQAESQVLSQNERTIDQRLEDLSYSLGRALSSQEESSILDIVDEYTPTGDDGRYTGELLPMDKAWEIYNLRTAQTVRKNSEQRRAPTVLTGARTEGEPSTKSQADKDWNPRDWNAWRKRIPN